MLTTTNTPDTITIVPQERPAEDVSVTTSVDENYWFRGLYCTEGPWGETQMRAACDAFPTIYRAEGTWWERTTVATTRVTERLHIEEKSHV